METLHSLHEIDTPVGAKGVTVRRGRKWFDADVREGLELCVCRPTGSEFEHELAGHARVFSRQFLSFSLLTDEMLQDEHEESSRTVAGLLASMRRAYGPDFSEDETVTVIHYWRTD